MRFSKVALYKYVIKITVTIKADKRAKEADENEGRREVRKERMKLIYRDAYIYIE